MWRQISKIILGPRSPSSKFSKQVKRQEPIAGARKAEIQQRSFRVTGEYVERTSRFVRASLHRHSSAMENLGGSVSTTLTQ